MMTVKEVSRLTGVSVRTLQYYDRIGLLHPAGYTESGYRLYDDATLETLQQILLFRELEFPLKQISQIIQAPDFDRNRALEQQITMLQLKKEHLENLILFARGIQLTGVRLKNKPDGLFFNRQFCAETPNCCDRRGKITYVIFPRGLSVKRFGMEVNMDFKAFDTSRLDEYSEQARKQWGQTAAWQEFEEKNRGRNGEAEKAVAAGLMLILEELGKQKSQGLSAKAPSVQDLVKQLQNYITEHYYQCTPEILSGLGKMYADGGDFTVNIDRACGEGTAVFAGEAIAVYCEGVAGEE